MHPVADQASEVAATGPLMQRTSLSDDSYRGRSDGDRSGIGVRLGKRLNRPTRGVYWFRCSFEMSLPTTCHSIAWYFLLVHLLAGLNSDDGVVGDGQAVLIPLGRVLETLDPKAKTLVFPFLDIHRRWTGRAIC